MRQRLTRPTAALFPIVGLVAALLSSAARDFMLLAYLAYFAVQLLSLCAADSFRNAAACEPGVRRVDRRFGGALLCALVGSGLALLICARCFRPASMDAGAANHAEYLYGQIFLAALSAALINFEHLFEERMFALGRRVDGVLLSCISNGMLLAGALIDEGAGAGGGAFALAAGLGAALSIATGYAIEPPHGFALAPRNLPFFPRACAQALLYPAAACAAALLLANGDGARLEEAIPAVLYGLIPWRLARTTARRTLDESRPLNLLLVAFAAIPAMLAAWLPAARPFALAGTLALACGAAVFCAPGGRLYAGIALTAAALLPISYPWRLSALSALAALLLNGRRALRKRR